MTPAEFAAAAQALVGTTIGWQSKIARLLPVHTRAVRRWLVDGTIPAWVEERMAVLLGMRDSAPWPRDEWLIGDGVTGDGRHREYIAHLAPPRFVARIVECEQGLPCPDELPADILSGTVYVIDGDGIRETVLCEIDWIDTPPTGQVPQLLEAAADAIDKQNQHDQLGARRK